MDNNKNNKDNKKNSKKSILIIVIAVVVILLAVLLGFKQCSKSDEGDLTSTSQTTNAPTSEPDDQLVKNPIDFKALREGNREIFAWIKVDDTEVDYPICQSSNDDSFYLKHKAEDKSWSASGAIYIELCNSKNFGDRVTLVYGHNGYGDTMFTTLHKFEKEDFFNEHPYFYIYTQSHKLTYQVVSAFKYDNRHIMNSFDFNNDKTFTDFCDMIQNPDSTLKNTRNELETELNEDSNIVVLSTCITNQKSSRYLVCGVLINDEKTY